MNDSNLWYLLGWKFIMRCRTCEVTLASVDDINDYNINNDSMRLMLK